MLKDIRHGIRVLLQTRGWTAVVVLTLAVGIGANTAVITASHALLFQTVSVRDPESLVRLRWTGQNDMSNDSSDYGYSARHRGQGVHPTFSYPMFQHFRTANQTLSDLAASAPISSVTLVIDGAAETATAFMTSGNYYSLLGVGAQIGRTIVPEDDNMSAPLVAMLSDRYWRSRFSATPAVIGRAVRINNVPAVIVGVLGPEFTGTQRPTQSPRDIWLPSAFDARRGSQTELEAGAGQMAPILRINDPTAWWVQITGRLKPGVTTEHVRGNLETVFQHQARAGMEAHLAALPPEERSRSGNQDRSRVPQLLVDSARSGTYDATEETARSLAMLAAVVSLVLLLVCANVANLLLARGQSRQREISVRRSLGATRWRVVRQLLTESLLLAGTGGAAGLLIARWSQAALPAPVGTTSAPVSQVILIVFVLTVLTGLVFGIAPALRATHVDIGTALKDTSRSTTGSSSSLARALVVLQVAISVVLLIGAALLLRTLENLRNVDLGFDPHNLVFVRVDVESSPLSAEQKFRYFDEALRQMHAVPGVRAAAVSWPTLMSGGVWTTAMYVEGRDYPRGRDSYDQERDEIFRVIVSPSYFAALGIPLVAGRGIIESDHDRAPRVAVINEAAARKFFPNENPIGRRFGTNLDATTDVQIVGVLRNVRYNRLREQPPPTMYMPYRQANPDDLAFSVRTAVDPASVMPSLRSAAGQANASIPVIRIETQTATLEERYAQEKVLAQAYALFGGIALFIAAIGLFGLLSFTVARRTREIGIRMAMGAQRQEVLGLVLRESMLLVLAGIVIGIAAALGAGRLIASQLFGLEPTDATTFVSAIGLMIVVAAAAGYLPARRATRVDPMIALRYE